MLRLFQIGLLFLLCKVCISCSGKNVNCKNFKTGQYVYHNPFTGNDLLITRTDSIQVSVDKKTGIGNKSGIEWTGDCEYKLTFLAFIINGRDSVLDNNKYPAATTRILKSAKDYYIGETRIPGDMVHVDTVWSMNKEN